MPKRNRKTVRNKNICALRRLGISYRNIAWRYDLSIIRVRQIIEAQEGSRCQKTGDGTILRT